MEDKNYKFTLNNPTALVLEGGGMRCIFTAGVLDAFMDNSVTFPYAIGASGGASTALSYYSQQRGRTHYINIILMDKFPYMGWRSLLRNGRLVDLTFLFHDVPDRLSPFEYNRFFANKNTLEVVTTNCDTGEAHYFSMLELDRERLITIGHASSSLPILCDPIYIDGVPMLDGGLADSIPYERAISKGYKDVLVVTTQNSGFRKKSMKVSIPSFILRKFPKVKELLMSRPSRYNRQVELLEELENRCDGDINISVIRPESPIKVGRFTSDPAKLQDLYDSGYALGEEWMLSHCHRSL